MSLRIATLVACGALILTAATPALAARGPTKCSSIYAVCLQRAQGQSMICDGMYQTALASGRWQATEEPDGTKHPSIPCSK